MAERTVKPLTLPSGATAEIKEYITTGEFLDINEANGGDLSKNELAKRLVSIAVASINGSTVDIPNTLRSLPLGDYLFLSKEVTKIVNGDFMEAKTQAQS